MAKVLIIEDEKAMSDLIAIKFKVEGFEVDQAFSLAEAKVKLTAPGVVYDAILSDYLLPDGNSLDLFTELRPQPQVAKVPIVLATNYVEDLSQDKAKSLGVSEVIVKYQVVPAQMVEKVKHLISPSGTATPSTPAAAPAPQPSIASPAPVPVAPPQPPVAVPASPVGPPPPPQAPATIPVAPAVPSPAPVAPPVTPAPAAPVPVAPTAPVDPNKPQ
jgi:CheY-like chemotaxis protein